MSARVPEPLQAILDRLHAARLTGYGAVLPGPLDRDFSELARAYLASSPPERAALRAAVPPDLSLLLIGFSDRLATLAARTGSEESLTEALVAHAIEGFRHDPRENILRLSVVNHVARRLKVDPGALFARVAAMASPEAREQLEAFAARPEATKSLKAMRLREVQTPQGVAYVPT
jgi:hypothetical protein